MKELIKLFNEEFMDETCDDIGDTSTELLSVTRIKNGFKLTFPTGKTYNLINKHYENIKIRHRNSNKTLPRSK